MPHRVQYPDDLEPLVQFIEETPPAEILDGIPARGEEAVIVDDQEAAGNQLVVEEVEAFGRGAVEIDVDPKQGERPDRSLTYNRRSAI